MNPWHPVVKFMFLFMLLTVVGIGGGIITFFFAPRYFDWFFGMGIVSMFATFATNQIMWKMVKRNKKRKKRGN